MQDHEMLKLIQRMDNPLSGVIDLFQVAQNNKDHLNYDIRKLAQKILDSISQFKTDGILDLLKKGKEETNSKVEKLGNSPEYLENFANYPLLLLSEYIVYNKNLRDEKNVKMGANMKPKQKPSL